MAGLQHVYQSWRKPFNPILGETWQAQLSDGTVMFMEQMSHHPPVTAFHMIGAGNRTRYTHYVQTCLQHGMKHNQYRCIAIALSIGKLLCDKRNSSYMTISRHSGDVATHLCY